MCALTDTAAVPAPASIGVVCSPKDEVVPVLEVVGRLGRGASLNCAGEGLRGRPRPSSRVPVVAEAPAVGGERSVLARTERYDVS